MTIQPSSTNTLDRVPLIDHMRGFIFLLMAIDHSLHAYAANWGRYWFYRDYDRSYLFDALYLFNQAAIMPVLFFTFGAYVLPKITALGWKAFWQDRFIKHVIPFMVGIPLVVPLLSYPKFHEYENPGPLYSDFWQDIFFSQKLQAGPYWVMYAIVLYTAVLLLLNYLFPKFIPWLGTRIKAAITSPLKSFGIFIVFSMVVYGLSDLRWGAPWWIGLRTLLPDFLHGELFSLQGSKFLMNFAYFALGSAFVKSKVWETKKPWHSFKKNKVLFLSITIFLGLAYTVYAHFYFSETFDYSIYRAFQQADDLSQAWHDITELLPEVGSAILIRTSLLATLTLFQVLTLITFFGSHTKRSKTNPFWSVFWSSSAACCWGIFMIHDPIVVWGQFFLTSVDWPIALKAITVGMIAISTSWIATHFLLKVPYVRSVFELD